jgi:endonuclease/exonuclease/phosphatase family metal-dependent hydrolase
VAAVIERWSEKIADGDVVIAGDFNCIASGPTGPAHLENVRRLDGVGAHSAYHAFHGVPHGREDAMTLRWVGPKRVVYEYHCDFVFLPDRMLPRLEAVEVGAMDTWVESRLSDHTPVTVTLRMPL